jgi:hypothetical protein
MIEKERELKSFNQCADALNTLEKKSILKVFHMLSIHFEIVDNIVSRPSTDNFENLQHEESTAEKTKLIETNNEQKKQSTKNNSTSTKKVKSSASKGPIYLTDFDFNPSGQKSLKDYYSEFEPKTNYDKNLIFVYYLQEILSETNISTDHIYSCYRNLGLKIPSFPQTLIDTNINKGWISTSNTSDIKVTRNGMNHIIHEMQKNDK